MTSRDEARKRCIDAMEDAAGSVLPLLYDQWGHSISPDDWHNAFAAAFDSLNGIATVNLPEATAQMIEAAVNEEYPSAIFRVMSARGNLTNPPEKKP